MHFGVCVVTNDRPTGPVLGAALKPFEMGSGNGKWDWWVLGGRYSGVYAPGCKQGEGMSIKVDDMAPNRVYPPDQMQFKDLPVSELRMAQRTRWEGFYDRAQAIIGGRSKPDQEGFGKHPLIDALRTEFYKEGFAYSSEVGEFWLPKDVFLKKREDETLVLPVYVKDGTWGECSEELLFDPDENDRWTEHFNVMLLSLDPEDWISVVDCHY